MAYPKIFHDSRFADAAPVASSFASGKPAVNLRDFRPYTEWQPAAMPAWVRVDCGIEKTTDYVLVWGHNLGSKAATFNVRYSPLGSWAGGDDLLAATIAPADDRPFLIEFAGIASRHWGIEVTGAAVPALGIVAIGRALAMPDWLGSGFDPVGRKPQGIFNRSVAGMPLGREIRYELWEQAVVIENTSWSWLRSVWIPAWSSHLRSKPFVFAWDPEGHPDELALATVKEGFEGPHKPGSRGDLRFELTGVLAR